MLIWLISPIFQTFIEGLHKGEYQLGPTKRQVYVKVLTDHLVWLHVALDIARSDLTTGILLTAGD